MWQIATEICDYLSHHIKNLQGGCLFNPLDYRTYKSKPHSALRRHKLQNADLCLDCPWYQAESETSNFTLRGFLHILILLSTLSCRFLLDTWNLDSQFSLCEQDPRSTTLIFFRGDGHTTFYLSYTSSYI